MKIAVFGLGYVGFTVMCCISKEGHSVVGFDVNESKISQIRSGVAPIMEPGLSNLLAEGLKAGSISAHTEIGSRLSDCDMAIVCVGTPSASDGSHNMAYIAEVTRQIAVAVSGTERVRPLTTVYRSTIRPGSMDELIRPIFVAELGEMFSGQIELVYNPEFLRESSAVQDFFAPPKIVIGTENGQPNENMATLNENILAPTFNVRFREAEITKFVDNTWHAVKVAYANEIGRICLQLDISASKVHEIFVSDTKLNISPYYTRPGGAFGGSCLPKDVRALQHIAADCGANAHLVDSLIRSNEAHKYRLLQRATENLDPGARVLLAGLAFKADTDDLRESPNVDLARSLLSSGYSLSIFDPAIDERKLIGANLGYAYTRIPTLSALLVTREQAEAGRYSRVIGTNATVKLLSLPPGQEILDLSRLA